MGVTFRSGEYVRFVQLGHRTIKDGEAAAIWNARGELTEVVGPRRVTLWFSTIRFLYHHTATRGQYLKVEYRNGVTEHVLGPIAMYFNPTHHQKIQVFDGYNLATEDDCLVMYAGGPNSNNQKKGMEASRRIVYGPQFVLPSEQETVHTFQWQSRKDFHILHTNTIEIWKKTVALPTQEGHTVQVHLVIRYKIAVAEKCLHVPDPFAHMDAALSSDAVAAKSSQLTLANVAQQAAAVETLFPNFFKATQECGFNIQSVCVTDVALPQSVTDKNAAETRDREQQQKAVAHVEHEMRLAQLELEKNRGQAQAQAELDKLQSELDTQVAEQSRSVEMTALEKELSMAQMRRNAMNEATRQANEARLDYLRGLAEMSVDVTKVLCAEVMASRTAASKKDNLSKDEQSVVGAESAS